MCFDEGTLQAYLDRELTLEREQAVKEHLLSCRRCRTMLEDLEDAGIFVSEHLAYFNRGDVNENDVNTQQAWQRFNYGVGSAGLGKTKKGVLSMFGKYKTAAVAAAMVLALTLSFSFDPVRSFAGNLLTIFRVERVQTINIGAADMEQLERAFREGAGNVDVESFGKFEVVGNNEYKRVTMAEAGQGVGFALKSPATPEGYTGPEVGLTTGSTVNLTLDIDGVNAVLQGMGSEKLLPRELDGRTFSLKVPAAATLEYSSPGGDGNKIFIGQSRSPELVAPGGTDVLALRDALLAIPALPDNLRQQLAAVKDWQHTALIPNVRGESADVRVNGNQGVFISNPGGDAQGMSALVWQQNGVVYMVSGSGLTRDQALDLASQME